MSSEVKIWNGDFMENQSENESLRARIREVEDENQDLRAQNLIQNRTIVELKNEMVLMRIQMTEMADTSALLRERVRNLTQNIQHQQENEGTVGPVTAPPLMAPPPVPPPLPPARIRISPRQVGAGEALTTPLGVSLSSPPRHRIKRDCRQGFYRSIRPPYRRLDTSEPGPSTPSPLLSPDRPNYLVDLRIIPQFQTSFGSSQSPSSGYSDSASDSSGSDENPQLSKKAKLKTSVRESPFKKTPFPKDFELLKNVRNLHHPKVRQTILQNYNLSIPSTNTKFFFPLPWDRKNRENSTLPSTSGNPPTRFSLNDRTQTLGNGMMNIPKISNYVQYTFPTIHEGLHREKVPSVVTNIGQPSRLRKLKKNIPYFRTDSIKTSDENKDESKEETFLQNVPDKSIKNSQIILKRVDLESLSSTKETERSNLPPAILTGEVTSDVDQDGFQADESSNCMTSTDNSLEKICLSESNIERKAWGNETDTKNN